MNFAEVPLSDVHGLCLRARALEARAAARQRFQVPLSKVMDPYYGGIDVMALLEELRDELRLSGDGFIDKLSINDLRSMLASCIAQTEGSCAACAPPKEREA